MFEVQLSAKAKVSLELKSRVYGLKEVKVVFTLTAGTKLPSILTIAG